MKKTRAVSATSSLYCFKQISFILLFLLFFGSAHGQDKRSNGKQWKSVGGQIVASGSHDFTNFWYHGGNGMWYKNDENRKNPATHTSDEVTKDVIVKKGQIAVRGPGFIAKFQRRVKSTAVGVGLKFTEKDNDFWPASLGGQDMLKGVHGWTWYDNNIIDFDPAANNGGWVPEGKTLTLDIIAANHQSGIGYTQYAAPKSVEYEFWFFPREGGQVISKADINSIDNNNPGHSVGKITSGNVFDETTNKWLKPGDNVRTDHILSTEKSGNATITFTENNTVVKLNNNTKIKILDKITKKKSGGISLYAGRLWSLFKGKKGKSGYAVETFNSVTSVEGTEFETTYDPITGETNVSVFEGVVSFECKTGTAPPVYIEAGMSASMDKNCKITSQNSTIPEIVGDWEITCNDGNIYQYNLILVQNENGFYGDMIRSNGNEANSKVEGTISQDGSIKFMRSRGNWKQYFVGSVVNQSGSKVLQLEGTYGTQQNTGSAWIAKHKNTSNTAAVLSIAGEWNTKQSNGYSGKLSITQDPSGRITGNAIWNGYLKGTVSGQTSGNDIEFTISYPGGDKGLYKGTLTDNGTRIVNGTAKGNNGVSATWEASQLGLLNITGQWNVNQSTGDKGIFRLQQDAMGAVTGSASWNGNWFGSVKGTVTQNNLELTISYPGNSKGYYKGTISGNGTKISDGTANGSDGSKATWEASK